MFCPCVIAKSKCMGFTEDEEYKLRRFVERNSPLIWEIAREDGEVIAYDI